MCFAVEGYGEYKYWHLQRLFSLSCILKLTLCTHVLSHMLYDTVACVMYTIMLISPVLLDLHNVVV